MKANKQKLQSTPDLRHLRASILKHDYGDPAKQKDELVEAILESFRDPSLWPMTDTERVKLLRDLHSRASKIRDTERAITVARA